MRVVDGKAGYKLRRYTESLTHVAHSKRLALERSAWSNKLPSPPSNANHSYVEAISGPDHRPRWIRLRRPLAWRRRAIKKLFADVSRAAVAATLAAAVTTITETLRLGRAVSTSVAAACAAAIANLSESCPAPAADAARLQLLVTLGLADNRANRRHADPRPASDGD